MVALMRMSFSLRGAGKARYQSSMQYVSTRGFAGDGGQPLSFEDVLLAGLAPDGGLFVPSEWPGFKPHEIEAFAGQSFASVASRVLWLLTGDCFSSEEITTICERAFASFPHPATTPIVQTGPEEYLLELFHGPTLAFKDVAMQVLGGMFETVLSRRNQHLTIIGATSGDTGGAAIEALKNRTGITVYILHPAGRISEVQRRIMTTTGADNIFNLAVDGSFDDCQAIVKSLFADREFVEDVNLGGVNSINWARILVQTVYYFTAAAAIGGPGRTPSFVVPTGNFGDIFAGYVAGRMGLPIGRLAAAVNENDIVHRVLSTGHYRPGTVAVTPTPSMDIQVASNFERLLYEACGRDSAEVRSLMENLRQSGGFALPEAVFKTITAQFVSASASVDDMQSAMRAIFHESGMIIDPHTAVGVHAARQLRAAGSLNGPVITLATAHPAKFPDTVEQVLGIRPPLPAAHADLFERTEEMRACANEAAAVKMIIRGDRQR